MRTRMRVHVRCAHGGAAGVCTAVKSAAGGGRCQRAWENVGVFVLARMGRIRGMEDTGHGGYGAWRIRGRYKAAISAPTKLAARLSALQP